MGKSEACNKPSGPKANKILKTLERCLSIGGSGHRKMEQKRMMPPVGCFSVHVGPTRERFVIRTECVNHPLFQMLLNEAEMEYGYATPGPIELPCDVKFFRKVLTEMEQEEMEVAPAMCSFVRKHSGYNLMSPARSLLVGHV